MACDKNHIHSIATMCGAVKWNQYVISLDMFNPVTASTKNIVNTQKMEDQKLDIDN